MTWSPPARQRAIGVEYQKGERLYRADPRSSAADGERRSVYAAREVILAGGTFNTPQLLMLSGVGPREGLARHGITVLVPLEGVGRNLQDRYEVAVENRMKFDSWKMLEGAAFNNSDPQVQGVGNQTRRRLHDQRRDPVGDRSIDGRSPGT